MRNSAPALRLRTAQAVFILLAAALSCVIPPALGKPEAPVVECNGDCTLLENVTSAEDGFFTISEGSLAPPKRVKGKASVTYKKTTETKKSRKDADPNPTCVDGCWVMERPGPDRDCRCMNSTASSAACFGAEIQVAEECTICDRGFGVYSSLEECMSPPDEEIQAVEAGIDPSSYPTPPAVKSGCPSKKQKKTTHSECPHVEQNLALWEDPWTWDGKVPTPGEWVTLPQWKKVLVTSCSVKSWETYAAIVVPQNSELIFSDEDIHMSVGVIYVHGRMRIGSQQCRILSSITITFNYIQNKKVPFKDLGIIVTKSGQLDVHGKRYYPTWTRLAKTASAGSNYAELQEAVDWQPGQMVFVTTTVWKDEWDNQNEVLTLSGVSKDKTKLFFSKALRFNHYGGPEYQAEVGLLSRNILFQGVKESNRYKKGPGVRMVGQGRISGLMAYRMGQKNVIGAYPIHFHLMGYAPHSYVTDSSIYKAYYRGVAVHGTKNILVKENVAFDVIGHCYYLEDGVEEFNWFEKNLAAYIHVIGKAAAGIFQEGESFVQSKDLAQPADSTASGFYITNAHNTFKDNAASGGYSGFAFPKLNEPLKEHAGMMHINPGERPVLVFDGNTAHSSGYYWFRGACIYFGGFLWRDKKNGDKLHYNSGRHSRDSKDNDGKASFNVITNTKVFLCNRGVNHWGARAELHNYKAIEVTRGATLFGEAIVKDAFISTKSGNKWSSFPGSLNDIMPIAGFQWYDDSARTIISDTTFEGYKYYPGQNKRQSVFLTMVHSDEFKPSGISATSKIKYIDVDEKAILWHEAKETGASRYFNWMDHDGSSVMKNTPMIIGSWPSWWKLSNGCSWKDTWGVWLCPRGPGQELARLDVRVPWYTKPVKQGQSVPPTKNNQIGYVAQFAEPGQDARKMTVTKNEGITGVTGDLGWYLHLNGGAPAELEIFVIQIPKGASILFSTRFPSGTRLSVEKVFKWSPSKNFFMKWANSVDQVQQSNGDTFTFDGKHLYVKITEDGDSNYPGVFTRDGISLYGNRWFDVSIKVKTGMNCPWKNNAPLCGVQDFGIPKAVPDKIKMQGCTDFAPNDHPRCANLKQSGKCQEQWVKNGNYCQMSCGRCSSYKPGKIESPPAKQSQPKKKRDRSKGQGTCDNKRPPGDFSCAQQKSWGKCSEAWIRNKNFCKRDCGHCGFSAAEGPTPEDTFYNVFYDSAFNSTDASTDGGLALLDEEDMIIAAESQSLAEKVEYCHDVTPVGRMSCGDHKAWGRCDESWMKKKGLCALTCGRCSFLTECLDIPSPDGSTCEDIVNNAKCNDPYTIAGGYCEKSCSRCAEQRLSAALEEAGIDATPILQQSACDEILPPGTLTCVGLVRQGRCFDEEVVDNNLCAKSCGRCT
ncbi:hypothetical protein BSKO_09727 [Bryopsis sp. KO-2023]|nr:hypothetical protein BSKO_09727 [Bryopsis sp. KO-2023]